MTIDDIKISIDKPNDFCIGYSYEILKQDVNENFQTSKYKIYSSILSVKDNKCDYYERYNVSNNIMKTKGKYVLKNTIFLPTLQIPDQLKKVLISKLKKVDFDTKDLNYYEFINFGDFIKNANISDFEAKKIFNRKNKTDKTITSPTLNFSYVYEYNNKKYVRFKYRDYSSYAYYKIEPIIWKFYPNKNKMVFAYPIIADIVFGKSFDKNIKLEDTIFYKKYLKGSFLKELLQYEQIMQSEKQINYDEDLPNISDKIKYIKELIEKDVNKDKHTNRLRNIILNYKKQIELYDRVSNEKLVFGVKDEYSIEKELEINLMDLKDEILLSRIKKTKDMDMVNYLNKLYIILNYGDILPKDSFQQLMYDLVNGPDKYLNDPVTHNLLIEKIYYEPKRLITDCIINNKKLPYKNKKELIIDLRKRLHPILNQIRIDIHKKTNSKTNENIYEDIKHEILNIKENNYTKSHCNIIDMYLNMLQGAYNELISISSNHKTIIEAQSILNEPIDYNLSLNEICAILIDKYKKIRKKYYEELDTKTNNEKMIERRRRLEQI